MDLHISAEETIFREEVQQFLAEQLTPEIREAGRLATSVFADAKLAMAWQKILYKKGWAAPNWPKEYGGTGWTVSQRAIFIEETIKAEAPSLIPMGLSMCGPMLIGCGTAEQKSYYLPRILSGEDFWCQGYSEPGAGSDLASLQTFAESDGDDYVINGSKIWTTYAMHANKMFALVRTNRDVKPQAGITFLLIDMDSPGITVEPIVGLDEVPEQCQVFFENVRVPKKNRISEENMGWSVAKYLLIFERGGAEFGSALRIQLEKIKKIAEKQTISTGKSLIKDDVFCHKLAQIEIDIIALQFTENRIKSALGSGNDPGALSSMTKILGTEIQQRIYEIGIEALGTQSLIWQPQELIPNSKHEPVGPEYAVAAMARYLNSRATSIFGGSNEIQRGIIAKLVLGL